MEAPISVSETNNNTVAARKEVQEVQEEKAELCNEHMTSVDQKSTEATDEETCSENVEEKSLAMASSDDNTCTTLRLDTVMNIKSKSADFLGEEKKDDSDEPIVIEEPIGDMPVASVTVTSHEMPKADKAPEPVADFAEEGVTNGKTTKDASNESLNKEEALDIVVKESTIEEATGVVAPLLFDFEHNEEEDEEETTPADEIKSEATPGEAYSRTTEEAQMTTQPTLTMDSDSPAGEAQVTTKMTSMSESLVAEESMLSKKSSGDSLLVPAEDTASKDVLAEAPVAQKANKGGLFSCGVPLCGNMSDVVDSESDKYEAKSEPTKDEEIISHRATTFETPMVTEEVAEVTSDAPTSIKEDTPEDGADEDYQTERGTKPDAPTPVKEKSPEEETPEETTPEEEAHEAKVIDDYVEENSSKLDDAKEEDTAEVSMQASSPDVEEKANSDIEEKAAETEVDDAALNVENIVETEVVPAEEMKDDDILEGPRMIDIANMKIDGVSFDVQEGYSCAAFFNCGGSLRATPAKTVNAMGVADVADVRMTLSQDLIMEAREEGEKELENNKNMEPITTLVSLAEETTPEQSSPFESPQDGTMEDVSAELKTEDTAQPALEGALKEELKANEPISVHSHNLEDAQVKENMDDFSPNDQPQKDLVVTVDQVVAEKKAATGEQETDVVEHLAVVCSEEDAAPVLAAKSSSCPEETSITETEVTVPADEKIVDEERVAEPETTESPVATLEDPESPEAEPSGTPEKRVAEPLADEETMSMAQQEAYACGNGTCTIL